MDEHIFNIELISLDSINILNATLQNDAGLTTMEYLGYDINFQYQLVPSVSITSKRIRVVADYEIRASKKGSDVVDIKSQYKIAFIYSVERIAEFAFPDDDELVTVDDEMLSSVLNITYSTSRGILYTRCLGTVMDGLILPIIPTADLLNKPTAIKQISMKK
jgi:hypothetical protein